MDISKAINIALILYKNNIQLEEKRDELEEKSVNPL